MRRDGVMATLGFVGLGQMGAAMARRLLDAGHTVQGYNRTPAKTKALVDHGLRLVGSPRAAAEGAEAVFSMVTDPDAVRAIGDGTDGIVAGLGRGAVWVECSTVSPDASRALAEAVEGRGAAILDAPVSGSPVTVQAGQLSFMVGGDAAALERVRPYLLAIGPTITHLGPLGLGASMKLAINLTLGVQMLAFSEAVALAEKAGIGRERAVEALLRSVAASPMLKYRGPFVLDMPARGFSDVAMMQKDLRLALALAQALGVPLPTAAATQEMLTGARGLGRGTLDFAAVFDVVATLSGLPESRKAAADPS